MEDKYPVQLHLRIDWSELDLFGHVNNVSFLKYIQAARVSYWEKIGLYQEFLETRIGPMLASTGCTYKKPLFYPGSIVIHSRMAFIKNTSFSIHHRIVDHENDVAAEAQDVMVMYDFNTNQKVQFPEYLRKAASELESRDL